MEFVLRDIGLPEREAEMARAEGVHHGRGEEYKDRVSEQPRREALDCD